MIRFENISVLKNNILVSEIEGGMQTKNGIIIPDDDMSERGIHPRWCKVVAVGPEVGDIAVGEWILVDHGRWSRGFEADFDGLVATFRWIDYKDVFVCQEEKPEGIETR